MDTKDAMEILLAEKGQMGKGTERPIPHEHVARAPRRMARSDLGPIVWVPGGGEGFEQKARPRLKEGEQVGHGEPTPWALSTRLAKVLWEFRRIGPRKTGPVDEERPVASPPSLVIGGRLADRGGPTQQQLPDDERSPGASLTKG